MTAKKSSHMRECCFKATSKKIFLSDLQSETIWICLYSAIWCDDGVAYKMVKRIDYMNVWVF